MMSRLARTVNWVRGPVFPAPVVPPESLRLRGPVPDDYTSLFVTGDVLVQRVVLAIEARRPVLLTGPRGSGKSFCARRGIQLAVKAGTIGGWRFLQGNREIPRDALSEDALAVGDGGKAGMPRLEQVVALALRKFDSPGQQRCIERQVCEREIGMTAEVRKQLEDDGFDTFAELRKYWKKRLPDWPAVPSAHIEEKGRPGGRGRKLGAVFGRGQPLRGRLFG